MKDKIYDAIIIGAGPAGASLAYFLSGFNLKIALVEKKKYADTPVRCAELVPKALTALYSDKIEGINNEISHMETYIEGRPANVMGSEGYILDRNIFVGFLIKEFKKRGGDYLNSSSFINATYEDMDENICGPQTFTGSGANIDSELHGFSEIKKLNVKIKHKNKITCLKTSILAGADGPYSMVAGMMQSMYQDRYGLRKIPDKKNSFLAGFQENIIKKFACKNHIKIFFYPFISGGYGWLFPKIDSLNLGIAVNMNSLKDNGLKSTYFRFKNELIKDSIIKGDEHINSTISGLAPVYGIKSRIVKNNIVLVGDAAGLCNPITGAGNYNAALSAKIVAEKIKTALQGKNIQVLMEAEKEVRDYLKTSLDHALKKRQILDKNNNEYDFENLIKKTWVSFKDYWRER
jgi:flavin-dependent dehydrogenase